MEAKNSSPIGLWLGIFYDVIFYLKYLSVNAMLKCQTRISEKSGLNPMSGSLRILQSVQVMTTGMDGAFKYATAISTSLNIHYLYQFLYGI
jgi:hypothetical protein